MSNAAFVFFCNFILFLHLRRRSVQQFEERKQRGNRKSLHSLLSSSTLFDCYNDKKTNSKKKLLCNCSEKSQLKLLQREPFLNNDKLTNQQTLFHLQLFVSLLICTWATDKKKKVHGNERMLTPAHTFICTVKVM